VTLATATVAPTPEAERPRPLTADERLREFHEEPSFGKAYDAHLAARLWAFVRPHRRLLYLATASILVSAASSLLRPLVMLRTIDDGIMRSEAPALLRGALLLAGLLLVEQVLAFVQTYSMQVAGARAIADLRHHIFRFLHTLRLSYFDRQPVGRLVTRVGNDTDAILELFASGALNAVGDLVRLIGIVALMLALDSHLALVAFAAAPPVTLLVVGVRGRAREAYRSIRSTTSRMNSTLNEQLTGVSVVQAFNRQEAARAEFDRINGAYRDATMRSIKYEAIQDAAIETIAALCLASIVLYLGYRPVSFGTVVAFNAYLLQFFEPISALAQRYTQLQSAMAGAERVFALLDVDEPDAEPRSGAPPAPGPAFALEGVDFAYQPGVSVLQGVSLEARPGEKIALVGPTGSGKSTIAGLLLRLYDPQAGVVRVLGEDVTTLDRRELRRRFSVVPQDLVLFAGSLADNIAAGDPPDPIRVERVLRRLGAFELLASREHGLRAPVLEQGSNFSAGERQLIAIARALYRDAPIVVLDEATASIDSNTELRVQRASEQLMAGRTALIIAHRLSTIRTADRIVVLQRGRIVEHGTHSELLAAGRVYARLYELQMRQSLQDPPPASAPDAASVSIRTSR
jgi:ATP-binding cassette, subfamily B, multidrug efflux pump